MPVYLERPALPEPAKIMQIAQAAASAMPAARALVAAT